MGLPMPFSNNMLRTASAPPMASLVAALFLGVGISHTGGKLAVETSIPLGAVSAQACQPDSSFDGLKKEITQP